MLNRIFVILAFAMLAGALVLAGAAVAQQDPGGASATPSATASAGANVPSEGAATLEDTSGIPAGTPAIGSNPSNPAGIPDLITIEVSGCTVDQGATIALEDSDGTEARFKDGKLEIDISTDASQVTIEGPDDENMSDHATFPTSDTSFDTDGDYRVVWTKGITGCEGSGGSGGGNGGGGGGDLTGDLNDFSGDNDGLSGDADRSAAEFRCEEVVEISQSGSRDQYNFSAARLQECLAREVIDDVKGGRLADTGGPPLLPVAAAFLLVGVGIFAGRAVLPRRER